MFPVFPGTLSYFLRETTVVFPSFREDTALSFRNPFAIRQFSGIFLSVGIRVAGPSAGALRRKEGSPVPGQRCARLVPDDSGVFLRRILYGVDDMSRIDTLFARLKAENRAAFIPFIMAGDPDGPGSLDLMRRLPGAGADMIELGMAFTDPVADGPVIQKAGLRALESGQTLAKTIKMVHRFRQHDTGTPVVLMGYYNPVHAYGTDRFIADAADAGVDGLIVVDLPPEEDAALCIPARKAGLDFIRLVTPSTDPDRLLNIVKNASGFIYYVSIAGVTGRKAGSIDHVRDAVSRIRKATSLPVAVGFGIRTGEQAGLFATVADGVVTGSALVETLEKSLTVPLEDGPRDADTVPAGHEYTAGSMLDLARTMSHAVRASGNV